MNVDNTLAALPDCQRAFKVISLFIIFAFYHFAVINITYR